MIRICVCRELSESEREIQTSVFANRSRVKLVRTGFHQRGSIVVRITRMPWARDVSACRIFTLLPYNKPFIANAVAFI